MLVKCEQYWASNGCPDNQDIFDCLDIINKRDYVMIELCWFGPDNEYYGGHHSILIRSTDDLNSVRARLPEVYYV